MADQTKHYLISGRVQDVGYRAFVAEIGERMHLKGWVQNLPDGRVEAVARGESALLLSFESRLRIGSPASEVDQVLVKPFETHTDPAGHLADRFEIRRSK